MKRIISITICLCLIFGSVLPVFAVTETWDQAANSKLQNILNFVTNFYTDWTSFITLYGDGTAASNPYTFQDLVNEIFHIGSWLVPSGSPGSSDLSIWDYVMATAQWSYNMVENSGSIISYISSWMSSNNSYLSSLNNALSNFYYTNTWAATSQYLNAHANLFTSDSSDSYKIYSYSNGDVSNYNAHWTYGTPLGNIAVILKQLGYNSAYAFKDILYGFNNTLTTWEHSNLSQTSFTPSSLANGLYRYLAYIQSDTAALWNNSLNGWSSSNLYYTNKSTGLKNQSWSSPNSAYHGITRWLSQIQNDIAYDYFRSHVVGSNTLGTFYYKDLTLNDTSVTYSSSDDLIRRALSTIQLPLARLAYVHADDNDIAAKQATADNEDAVLDNFLSGSGSASASVSDITTVADLSSGFSDNFTTTAPASGVWDIFDDDHQDWFSQSTADSLDTSSQYTQQTRLLRSAPAEEYSTPLLDQKLEELYRSLGVTPND